MVDGGYTHLYRCGSWLSWFLAHNHGGHSCENLANVTPGWHKWKVFLAEMVGICGPKHRKFSVKIVAYCGLRNKYVRTCCSWVSRMLRSLHRWQLESRLPSLLTFSHVTVLFRQHLRPENSERFETSWEIKEALILGWSMCCRRGEGNGTTENSATVQWRRQSHPTHYNFAIFDLLIAILLIWVTVVLL